MIAQTAFERRNGESGLIFWVWLGEKRMKQTDFIFFFFLCPEIKVKLRIATAVGVYPFK